MPLIAPPPIETSRLCIRLVTDGDLPALLQVNGDDEVTQFLPYATWQGLADAQAWLQRMAMLQSTGAALQFVVAEKHSGNAVGACLLFRHDDHGACAEIGYVLGRAQWGQGYMHEALDALLRCAFGSMGLRRLEAKVSPGNLASARLLLRLGFSKESLPRPRWASQGEPTEVEVYGLLSHGWQRRKLGER